MSAVLSTSEDKATCIRAMNLMATGTLDDIAEVYGPQSTVRPRLSRHRLEDKGRRPCMPPPSGCARPSRTSRGRSPTQSRTGMSERRSRRPRAALDRALDSASIHYRPLHDQMHIPPPTRQHGATDSPEST